MILGGAIGAAAMLVVMGLVIAPLPAEPAQEAPTTYIQGAPAFQGGSYGVRTAGAAELAPPGELSLIEIFERTESGTVRVEVRREGRVIDTNGVGSGFVFDTRGHIITNSHVVDSGGRVIVTFLDGSSYIARVVGDDPYTDIAVLKVDAGEDRASPLLLGDSSNLKVGEQIAAIGNPFGLSGSMTSGIVSQLGRLLPANSGIFQIPDVIQTDAAINPGNSGGPLLNMRGEVVGINTAIQSGTGEFAGIGFAIPSRTLAKIVPSIIRDGEYQHPWLGVSGRDIDPDLAGVLGVSEAKGFLVVSVVEDSPAHKAGLRGSTGTVMIEGIERPVGGDIIVAVDGIEVRKIDDILIHLQRQKSVGDEMMVEVVRDGKSGTFTLLLDERPGR
ncbi:trypsin-like serine protease [Cenarchaeum symbiosum A]|uniref:Trypsin-like serine protease n=1 Tax=Cenarchaeum symbiosum (strain A) TaxID=414004 RepID=A0RWZ4_CENSY|nr:trypsin-like serine protease [Cenarchaeum symbiosum A]